MEGLESKEMEIELPHFTPHAKVKSKQENSAAIVPLSPPSNGIPLKSKDQRVSELSGLVFEALSAKDSAWYDVASFLHYRVLHTGELEVRVRFSGFGNEEDEWVNVRQFVRERSIPLEPSECNKVNVGDRVLCFRESEDDALYCDAHILEIERRTHDNTECTCAFVVRYDHDSEEGKVQLGSLCCRPT